MRATYPAFTDGKDTMAGPNRPNRPNPRDISNKLCKSDVVIDSDRFLSPLVYIWGQVRSSGSSPRALCSASGCLLCYLNTSSFRPPFSVHHAQFIDHDFSKSTGGTAGDFVPIPGPKVLTTRTSSSLLFKLLRGVTVSLPPRSCQCCGFTLEDSEHGPLEVTFCLV